MANKITAKVIKFLGSRLFFWAVVAVFVLQALWIAFSFRYPMIYDESYHFGITQYFSHQWLPWINHQPPSLDIYGALGRQPYLLFHYVLSFPLKLVAAFTDSQPLQIISMRIVCIGLFTSGLILFSRLFREMKISPVLGNVALLFFVLLPATPFVAATINYDNAVFPLAALFMLLGVRILKNPKVRWQDYCGLLLVGLVGVLTKNVFIPVLFAGAVFIAVWSLKEARSKFVAQFMESFRLSSVWLKLALLVPLVVVGFLFTERFGVNIVRYHSLEPSCVQELDIERCMANPLEKRAVDLKEKRTGIPLQAPQYTNLWETNMISTLLWSGANAQDRGDTVFAPPLPIIYSVVFWGGIAVFAVFFYSLSKLRRLPGFGLIASIIAVYIAALYYINISAYNAFYQPVAVQGRYLLPLLPIIMAFALVGFSSVLSTKRVLKLPILVVVLLLYLNGAGIITHIVRSNDAWNWNNTTVRRVNNKARDILRPFIKESWYDQTNS